MPDYRLYPVDETGHIAGPPHVETCTSDEEAIAKAKSLVDGHDLEIWDRARMVAKIASER
jgi:hypothetical protein